MAGAALYIPNTSGVRVDNFSAQGVIGGCSIDILTQVINELKILHLVLEFKFRTTYGFNILGGAYNAVGCNY